MEKTKKKRERKITLMVPEELLERAMEITGEGLTPTVRRGLELLSAQLAYKRLLEMEGKFDIGIDDLDELRKDRDE